MNAVVSTITRKSIFKTSTKGSSTNHVDSRGGGGVPKVSMFVHMGGGGSKPLSMWIMIPTFLHPILRICKYWISEN